MTTLTRRRYAADVVRGRELAATGEGKRIRERARASQSLVGGLAELSPAAIASYETGRRLPRGESARRYARAIDYLSELIDDG